MAIVKEISPKGSNSGMSIIEVSLRTHWGRERKAYVPADKNQLRSEGNQTTLASPHHHLWVIGKCGISPKKVTVRKHGCLQVSGFRFLEYLVYTWVFSLDDLGC